MKIHLYILLFAAICTVTSAAAQTQPVAAAQGPDNVPVTTVVPPAQPSVSITEHTTVYEESTKGMDRAEKRAYRAQVYAARLDSLIQSRNFMFYPNSMQEIPGGLIRNIYAEYYYFGMFIDHVEVHLPTEQGYEPNVWVLNFDSMSIRNYQAAKMQWGWIVSFNVADGDDVYPVNFVVSTVTGETVLTLITPNLKMRYVGWLWDKKIDDKRYYRMN